jgi:hypothetical protein
MKAPHGKERLSFETAESLIFMIHISESNALTLIEKKTSGYIHFYPQVCNQKASIRLARSYAYHNKKVER